MTTYVLHVRLKENAPIGELEDEMIVVTNDEKSDQFSLPVSARIMPPVTVAPSLVMLGDIPRGQLRQQRFIVRSKKPFAITAVECSDDRFQFTLPTGEKPVHVLQLTFKGDRAEGDSGALQQKVLVKTSLGEDLTAEALVSGRVVN
jgi:hypothetical protein